MSVYVDNGKRRLGRMIMCHLLADTVEELHSFAEKIGCKRSWFQNEKTPHYDLPLFRRKLAIEAGAIEADRSKVVELIRRYRNGHERD